MRSNVMIRVGVGFIAGALLLAATPVRADEEADRGQARELGTQAYQAADKGDWARAEDLFRRADAIYHADTLLLGLARARAHLGKYVEAWEDYHRILIETLPPNASAAMKKAVDDARNEIGSVEGKRARVTVTVTGPSSPTVTIDGAPMNAAALGAERQVNPGTHAVHAEAAGYLPGDTNFTVAEGQSTTASLQLQPAPAAPAGAAPAGGATPATGGTTDASNPVPADTGGAGSGSTRRALGLVGMGVGAAGLVTGVITGVIAMSDHSSLTSNVCAKGPCGQSDLSSYQSSVSSYHTMGTISTIGFIAGGVLAAGGAILFFTAPSGSASTTGQGAHVAPYVGLGQAGLAGSF
jgi:hypothetical protein